MTHKVLFETTELRKPEKLLDNCNIEGIRFFRSTLTSDYTKHAEHVEYEGLIALQMS